MSNSTRNGTAFEERVTVQMTRETKLKLDQVLNSRPRGVSMSDLVREAIDGYLNGQADQLGSQAHFSRTLKLRLDELETRLTNYLNLLVFMDAHGFAQLVQALTGESGRVQPSYFMRVGLETMARDGNKLTNQLRMVERELSTDDKAVDNGAP